MDLRKDIHIEPRKRFHAIARFKRAVQHAETLQGYVTEHVTLLEEAKATTLARRQAKLQKRVPTKRKLQSDEGEQAATAPSLIQEAAAYHASMKSMLAFELKDWQTALQASKETVYHALILC